MFKLANLNMFKKLLVLSVLLCGLLIVSSLDRANAAVSAICCSACDTNYDNCVTACYNGDPRALNKCLNHCSDDFSDCYQGPPSCNINC